MNTPLVFQRFLSETEHHYRQKLASLPLFDPSQTSKWSDEQKKLFAAVFYHLRGYFIDFMWYFANFCSDSEIKSIVLENINEELGLEGRMSHEQLYAQFAQECGIDVKDEIINETHYYPFAKEFNKQHLRWLTKHDVSEQLAAFAAYEKLDNIDYPHLSKLAASLNLSDKAMIFFKVHVHVEHFEAAYERLSTVWENNPENVKKAFAFVYSHQYEMWQTLSDTIFAVH